MRFGESEVQVNSTAPNSSFAYIAPGCKAAENYFREYSIRVKDDLFQCDIFRRYQLRNETCICSIRKAFFNFFETVDVHPPSQSRSPSLRSSGRNARLWDNPFQGGI